MTEDDRRDLYASLLRGVAKEAQDRLCAADKQHAWGPWRRFAVRHDDVPLRFDPASAMTDHAVRVRSARRCLNCGKEQVGEG